MKLVIVSDITSGILPSIVAHFMGIKVIWYEGNLYPWIRNERNTSVGSMIIRGIQVTLAQLLGSITRVTIVNDGIIENALELSSIKSKIAVVRAGVNTSSFKPKDPLSNYHKFRIAFIGRLSDEKGACQLLHVCKYAEQHFPEVEFFILGDGPYKTKLQKLLNIRYIGSVEHDLMSEMLSTVDGVMTFQMTFGLGEVEALACGKPIIGSRIGEMPELISRKLGPIGLVCENSTLSYIESIRYLMEHKELLLQLSKNARQIATSEFDWDIITKKWKDVIVDA